MIDLNKNTDKIMEFSGLSRIVQILINRDCMDVHDAEALVLETRQEILDLIAGGGGSLDEVEEIIADNLGLEPDYIDYLGIW